MWVGTNLSCSLMLCSERYLFIYIKGISFIYIILVSQMQSAIVVVLYLQKTHVTCSYLCCQVLCFSVRPNSCIKYVFHQTWNFFIALIRAKKTLCPSSHSLNQFVATVANHTCLHNMHLPARMSPRTLLLW